MALAALEPVPSGAVPGTSGRAPDGALEMASARTNAQIAARLRQAADILALQGADGFRVAAYRRAADTIGGLDTDLGTLVRDGGRRALEAVPGVGVSIAAAVAEMLTTGRWAFLDHLKGAAAPAALLCLVPGIGPALARRIIETLHIRTLEALEMAAYDGRLEGLAGIGRRRLAMVRAALADLLGRVRDRRPSVREEPPVALLLDVDGEYRRRAAADDLPKIAPKRFNPSGEAWLPVLHTTRGAWHFTAIYSNTVRAHQLQRTADWVVIYFHKDGQPEGQRTVVTETRGAQASMRVVRGREAEGLRDRAPG